MQPSLVAPQIPVEAPYRERAPRKKEPKSISLGTQLAEFLLVGGATLLAFPLAYLVQQKYGTELTVYHFSFIAAYAAYVINDPHFAVTYVLFYDKLKERLFGSTFTGLQYARYIIAGFVVPAALIGVIAYAFLTTSPTALGWMIQFMFLAVGWHYVKQGFGVLSVLSARRGVRFSGIERWAIRGHCYAGWFFGWSRPLMFGGNMESDGIVYTAIGLGPTVVEVLYWAFILSGVGMVVALADKLRREGSIPIVPIVGLVVSVWLWVVFSGLNPVVAYAIPALHSIQYLYFVYLLKLGQAKDSAPQLGWRAVGLRLALFTLTTFGLGWVLFHGAPEGLDAGLKSSTWGLGPTPMMAAISTFVNIHHYFMDNCIWRRENPETRHLMA